MAEPQPESLGRQSVGGATWSGISRLAQQGLQTVSVAVLARLLNPSDYGLVAMAAFFTNFLQQLADFGTGSAVVQKENLSERLTSSLFWVNTLLGLGGGLLLLAAAPAAALYYHEPKVTAVLSVLALTFPVAGVGIVPQSLLIRRMEYRKLCIAEAGSTALATAVSITAALKGSGAWSLVYGSLTASIANSMLSWTLSSWAPTWSLDWGEVRSVMRYSINLTGFVIVNYFARNTGHLIVGRYLGPVALGYYQMAYSLLLYPLQAFGSVLGRVIFSTFARIQSDRERLRTAVQRYLTVIGAINLPVYLGLMVVAEPFVKLFLGAKWAPVVPLLMLIAPFGPLQAVSGQTGQIYLSVGRTDIMLRLGVAAAVIQVAGYLGGLPWGLKGVLLSWSISTIPVALAGIYVAHRVIDSPFGPLIRMLGPALLFSLVMTAVTWGWMLAATTMGFGAPLVLTTTIALGAMVYLGLIAALRPAFAEDFARLASYSNSSAVERITRRILRTGAVSP
jgi:O-antigen/teichoic acid export membrane protein